MPVRRGAPVKTLARPTMTADADAADVAATDVALTGAASGLSGVVNDDKRPAVCSTIPSSHLAAASPLTAIRAPGAKAPTEDMYVPPLVSSREWVHAAPNPLSTVATRRDWFRVMSINMMCDSITQFDSFNMLKNKKEKVVCPPITRVLCPAKTLDEFDQVMSWDFRFKRLVDQIRFYDPDIVCMNEVNRVHMRESLWIALRKLGYGGTFTSRRVEPCLAYKEDPFIPGNEKKSPFESDVGNATFFHKGRFYPLLQPGAECPKNIPFVNITGLADRVTNCTVMLNNVNFSEGSSIEDVKKREHQAQLLLVMIGRETKQQTQQDTLAVMVLGDFNNNTPEEPCVATFRDLYHSAYDVVGGPPWTAWYHDQRLKDDAELAAGCDASQPRPSTTDDSLAVLRDSHSTPLEETHLALRKRGIIKKTSDYIFFDNKKFSLLQVLDVPSEESVDSLLLPNHQHPSHHISLVADFAWNSYVEASVKNTLGHR